MAGDLVNGDRERLRQMERRVEILEADSRDLSVLKGDIRVLVEKFEGMVRTVRRIEEDFKTDRDERNEEKESEQKTSLAEKTIWVLGGAGVLAALITAAATIVTAFGH